MQTYSEFQPTGFDSKGLGLPNKQKWLVLPVMQTRDSELLERCNFESALKTLGGESPNVQVHRFNHWGPGWFEIIIINPKRKDKVTIAEEIESALADYPILDDSKYSEMKSNAIADHWESSGYDEVKDLIKERLELEETEIDKEKIHRAISDHSRYEVIDSDGSFHTEHMNEILDKIDPWSCLVSAEFYDKEHFDTLPHAIYHVLHKNKVKCSYAVIEPKYEMIPVELPEFITEQYNVNQIKMFPE